MDHDDALFFIEVDVLDIAAVFLDERSHACLDNFFDQLDSLTVIIIDGQVVVFHLFCEERLPTCVMFRDH